MKIRIGFVSNSSSSSFCAWGIEISDGSKFKELAGLDTSEPDESKIDPKILAEFKKLYEEFKSSADEDEDEEDILDQIDAFELLEMFEKVTDSLVFYCHGEYDDTIYVGRQFDIGDDETGKQFRDSTLEEIKQALPFATEEDLKCHYIEESWGN